MFKNVHKLYKITPLLIVVCLFGYGARNAYAESRDASTSSQRVSYIPLVGITLVPKPLALPNGPGEVAYHYAVKNFLREAPLTDIYVVDDTCENVKFSEGDDDGDLQLDYSETWRYVCIATVSQTTQSMATVVATSDGQVATHDAYATVIMGTDIPPPLVSVINITKVAYPLDLPAGGGIVTFTYKVSNPGTVPLSDVVVTDKKCQAVSNKLGDRNNNNLLDVSEVWIYTCKAVLTTTTTNTVSVTASANGLQATSQATITVKVNIPGENNETSGATTSSTQETGKEANDKILIWAVSSTILVVVFVSYIVIRSQQKKLIKLHE